MARLSQVTAAEAQLFSFLFGTFTASLIIAFVEEYAHQFRSKKCEKPCNGCMSVEDRVIRMVAEEMRLPLSKVIPGSRFQEDLGMDRSMEQNAAYGSRKSSRSKSQPGLLNGC
jgi:hypothetical protein